MTVKGKFKTRLAVEVIDADNFILLESLVFYSSRKQWGGDPIVVHTGFNTNFASGPKPLWPIVGPIGVHARADVIHDYLYAIGICSRIEADRVYKEALIECGVKKWKISAMYWAVRSPFGKIAWDRCRELDTNMW